MTDGGAQGGMFGNREDIFISIGNKKILLQETGITSLPLFPKHTI